MTKRLVIIFALLNSFTACQEIKEPWKWDNEQLRPVIIIQEHDGLRYSDPDTMTSGEIFSAKLYRQYQQLKDSIGNDMIKELKGYFFQVKLKEDTDPIYVKHWTSMNAYILTKSDTAYIEIPIDSVMKVSDKKVRWQAGYRNIYYPDESDTTYTIAGEWVLIDSLYSD